MIQKNDSFYRWLALWLLSVAAPVVFLSCGQNPAVTGELAAQLEGGFSGADPAASAPAVEKSPEDSGGNPDGADGKEGQNQEGRPGKDGISQEGDTPVIVGRDGQDGNPGRDGCGIRPFLQTFESRKMTEKEIASVILPYRATRKNPMDLAQIGEYKKQVSGNGYVKNTQQVFAIDLQMPPRQAILSVKSISLRMNLVKLSSDRFDKTEIVCFLDEKICSGGYMTAKNWQDNFNPAFSESGGRLINSLFSNELVGHELGRVHGMKLWGADRVALELDELLAGTGLSALDFLYGKDEKIPDFLTRTFKMVVADDTYVKDARLRVELEEDTCVSASIKPGNAVPISLRKDADHVELK